MEKKEVQRSRSRSPSHQKKHRSPPERPEDFEQGTLKAVPALPKTGGIYIPPFRLQRMLKDIKNMDKNTPEYQKYMWEMLRKSINGIVNKVNVSNIQNIIMELFNENLLRGKGLLARSIMKAQMAAPNFTHVYTALMAVLNTKLPDIVQLIVHRVLIQFQRAFKRNNKIVC